MLQRKTGYIPFIILLLAEYEDFVGRVSDIKHKFDEIGTQFRFIKQHDLQAIVGG
jgi:hypothetical protein